MFNIQCSCGAVSAVNENTGSEFSLNRPTASALDAQVNGMMCVSDSPALNDSESHELSPNRFGTVIKSRLRMVTPRASESFTSSTIPAIRGQILSRDKSEVIDVVIPRLIVDCAQRVNVCKDVDRER